MIEIKMTRKPQFKVDFDLPATEWLQIGAQCRRMMIDRTKSGIDIDGNQFAGYADLTKEYRAKLGKTTDVVNLEDRGEMHRSLSQKIIAGGAMVFYADRNRANIAIAHQEGRGRLPERKHFGLTDQQAETITQYVRTKINALAQRTFR